MKKFVYILIFIIGLNFTTQAQNKPATTGNGTEKLIKLYPIPASTVINFDFVSGYDRLLTFEVYNFTGKKVYELKNPPQKIMLSLTDFSRGFYFYKLSDKTGKLLQTERFLVLK
ncbi:MAG: T9SS type A sorting domain-containing protein [Ferruginibacter sp.]